MSASVPELVVSHPAAGVTDVLLNRPHKGNALNAGIVEAFHDAVDRAAETRLLVVRGVGSHFCTGFDLSDLEEATDGSLLHRFVRIELLLHKIFAAPFVTMALAGGRATGAGADLFAACDRRIVLRDAMMSFPGAGFGLILGTERLAHRIGPDRTRDLVRSGRALGGQEALAAGLATELIAEQHVDDVIARELAHARRLDAPTLTALHRIGIDDGSRPLAALVRSAAQPGLKDRVVAYRRAMQRQPR